MPYGSVSKGSVPLANPMVGKKKLPLQFPMSAVMAPLAMGGRSILGVPTVRKAWATFLAITVALALGAIAERLILADLGASSLHDGDEALYASVALEMARSGEALTPTYWRRPFLHKPPLPYWLMILSFSLAPGNVEFQARLPSALTAILLLAAVFAATSRLAGLGPGALATAVLLVNHQFLYEHVARSASFDAPVSFLMFAALMAGLRAHERFSWRLAAAALLGAVVMVKAPMAAFPATVAFVHHWVRDRSFSVQFLGWAIGGIVVVGLPWYAYQWITHGWEFWDTCILYEILGRATGATGHDSGAHAWIHIEAAWLSFLPWSPLLALGLLALVSGWPAPRVAEAGGVARAIAAYALLLLVFLCLIPSKWPWYGVPAYPAMALAFGVLVRRWLDGRWRAFLPTALAVCGGAGILLMETDPTYAPAARPAFLWPEHSRLYLLGSCAGGFAVFSAIAALTAAAVVPYLPRLRGRPGVVLGSSVGIIMMMLGFNLHTLLAVPQAHRSATSVLAARLKSGGVKRIFTLGFPHESRYGGRQDPLSSFYFGLLDVPVTDCNLSLDCLPPSDTTPTALIVWDRRLSPMARVRLVELLASRGPRFEIWIVGSGARGGFERLVRNPDGGNKSEPLEWARGSGSEERQ